MVSKYMHFRELEMLIVRIQKLIYDPPNQLIGFDAVVGVLDASPTPPAPPNPLDGQ